MVARAILLRKFLWSSRPDQSSINGEVLISMKRFECPFTCEKVLSHPDRHGVCRVIPPEPPDHGKWVR